MTINESLFTLSTYPINPLTIANIVEGLGLDGNESATLAVRNTSAYKRAQAKVYLFLADAPNVTEAGASYSFTEEQRKAFRVKAGDILGKLGEDDETLQCGYIGEDF